MTESARYSPLHRVHEQLGASFTDFAGWQMPVRYDSDLAEHHAVVRHPGAVVAGVLVLGLDHAGQREQQRLQHDW